MANKKRNKKKTKTDEPKEPTTTHASGDSEALVDDTKRIPAALLKSDAMAPLPPLSSLDSRRRWCPTLLNLAVMPLVDDACDFRLDVEIAALCAVG